MKKEQEQKERKQVTPLSPEENRNIAAQPADRHQAGLPQQRPKKK